MQEFEDILAVRAIRAIITAGHHYNAAGGAATILEIDPTAQLTVYRRGEKRTGPLTVGSLTAAPPAGPAPGLGQIVTLADGSQLAYDTDDDSTWPGDWTRLV